MDRDRELELLRRCLALTHSKQPPLTHDEALIPVAEYRDPALFDRELALLRRTPNLVACTSDLASPGDFVARDILGTPALLVRDDDGRARAFVNVCRHRGARVELRERGHCRRFVCPYHAWTYGCDGALSRPRHSEGFPTLEVADAGLRELPCFEAAGFVWVCPDPDTDAWQPDPATRTLVAELDDLGLAGGVVFARQAKVWNANWKLLVDGGLESYHFRIAHKDTIGGFFADNLSLFEMIGDHVRSVLPRLSILELDGAPEAEWILRKHTHLVYSVFPGASILLQEGHFDLIQMMPVSVDQTWIEIATVVPDPGPGGHTDKASRFWAANHDVTVRTLDEDFTLAEQIQAGMHTGANQHFRFARFEGALTEWHRRLDARLAR